MKRFLIALLLIAHTLGFGAIEQSILPYMNVQDNQKIRVMTYNMLYNAKNAEAKLPIKHRWEYRKERLFEYLAYANADIIGSQELQEDQVHDVMRFLGPSYDYYGLKTRQNEGRSDINAIFFKKNRFKLLDAQTVFYIDPQGENAFTCCYLKDLLQNKTIIVLNTKLSWGVSWTTMKRRAAEAGQLRDFASLLPAGMPIFLLGDFNTISLFDGGNIEKTITSGHLQDARKLALYGCFGPDCSVTNSNILFTPFTGPELSGVILDHIFLNDTVDVLSYGIDTARVNGEYASDHFPVIADLSLK